LPPVLLSLEWLNGCAAHGYASNSITSRHNLTTCDNNIKNEDQNYSHGMTIISQKSGM
jgi:hypothetical protein